MKLHNLTSDKGARRANKRVGRGISAGQGKTAGRGTKGAGSRSGSGGQLYREGGNLPFVRKLPFKRGFRNFNRVEYLAINLDDIEQKFNEGDVIDPSILAQNGFMKDANDKPVVILGRGELSKSLSIKAHRFSRSAVNKIETAGGSVDILDSDN